MLSYKLNICRTAFGGTVYAKKSDFKGKNLIYCICRNAKSATSRVRRSVNQIGTREDNRKKKNALSSLLYTSMDGTDVH